MRFVDRFTKDEVSAKVWWPFALLLIVLTVGSFFAERRAVRERRDDATNVAVAVIDGALADAMGSSSSVAVTGTAAQEARQTVSRAVEGIPDVKAVRVWAADGTLLFSTDARDRLGSNEAMNDVWLNSADTMSGTAVAISSNRGMEGQEVPSAFHVYTTMPGSTSAIGEVELSEGSLLSDVHAWWFRLQMILGLGALLVLILAILSVRDPVAKIGGGVPFYEATIPPGYALITADEHAELSQAGAHARERIRATDERVLQLEADKLRLEGELQRALSANASGIRPSATPGAAASPPVRRTAPQPMSPPPARVEAAAPRPPERTPPSVSPAAAVAERRTPEPERTPEPVASERAPEPVAEAEAPEVVLVPDPEPSVRDLVVVPEAEPEPAPVPVVPTTSKGSEADEHDAVMDVLNRLVDPVDGSSSTVDPSVIRARLARTAALKKPGSRERREERERDPS